MLAGLGCVPAATSPTGLLMTNPTFFTLTLSWTPGSPDACDFGSYDVRSCSILLITEKEKERGGDFW